MTTQPELNPPNLSYFQDFYILQMMQHEISTQHLPIAPKMQERIERLQFNIEYVFAPYVAAYLFSALLGEARHAPGFTDLKILELEKETTGSRISVFENAYKFALDLANVNILINLFGNGWHSSSYGGKAWQDIALGLKLYFIMPRAAWIDHVADLEHNGGCCFSKTENPYLKFNISTESMTEMLNQKRDADSLINLLIRLRGKYILDYTSQSLITPCDTVLTLLGIENPDKYTAKFTADSILNPDTINYPVFLDGKLTLKSNKNECHHCKKLVSKGDTFWVNTEAHCKACYLADRVFICVVCSNVIDKTNIPTQYIHYIDATDESTFVCDYCFHHRLITCPECQQLTQPAGQAYHEGKWVTLCAYCLQAYTYTCKTCKVLVYAVDIDPRNFQCHQCNQQNPLITCEHCLTPTPKYYTYDYKDHDTGEINTLYICHTCHYAYKEAHYSNDLPITPTMTYYTNMIEKTHSEKKSEYTKQVINYLKHLDAQLLAETPANKTKATHTLFAAIRQNLKIEVNQL